MNRNEFEELIRDEIAKAHDELFCKICGSEEPYVCWRCFQDAIEELNKRIERIEQKLKQLEAEER